MKYVDGFPAAVHHLVAPHAGAWIEMPYDVVQHSIIRSPPTRGRGLKWGGLTMARYRVYVAPHAGAWIEMLNAL